MHIGTPESVTTVQFESDFSQGWLQASTYDDPSYCLVITVCIQPWAMNKNCTMSAVCLFLQKKISADSAVGKPTWIAARLSRFYNRICALSIALLSLPHTIFLKI